ncbi:MAG: S41 family peptidase, partial [Myxococcota bacterium]
MSIRDRWRGANGLGALAVSAVLWLGCSGLARPGDFDPAPWLADYVQLRDALSAGYANLEWTVAERGLDPFALDSQAVAAIRDARDDRWALWALARFVAAFADPHLRLDIHAHPRYGTVPRYPMALAASGTRVVVAHVDDRILDQCPLRPGDLVTAVARRRITDELRRYTELIDSADPQQRTAIAARLILRSPFTPANGVAVTGRHGITVVTCRLEPEPVKGDKVRERAEEMTPTAWTAPADEVCKQLGFRSEPVAFPYPLPDGTEPVTEPGAPFPAAVVTTPAGHSIGLMRVASFLDKRQWDACVTTWNALRDQQDAEECAEACLEAFAYEAVRQTIHERLADTLEALRARAVAAIVVDIADNGGGNDWAEDLAAMLSPREAGCSPRAVIRHPHWSGRYAEVVGELDRLLARGQLADSDRTLLKRARAHAARMLTETQTTCDLRRLWTEPGYRPNCSPLAHSDDHLCGAERERLYQLVAGRAAPALRWDRRNPRLSVYTGPLFVLVNNFTASASEQFLGRLRAAGRGV